MFAASFCFDNFYIKEKRKVLKMFKERILYTKVSDFRADKYKIKTEIYRNRLGIMRVRKSPLLRDGWEHLDDLKRKEKLIEKQYSQYDVNVVKCIPKKDCIVFPYVEGKNLAELFGIYLSMNNERLINELVDTYIEKVGLLLDAKTEFKYTKEFKSVFGDIKFNHKQMTPNNPNIDLIFSNIILSKRGWTVIDYEWVFDFPIPINYILCRSIYLVLHENNRTDLVEKLIIEKLTTFINILNKAYSG